MNLVMPQVRYTAGSWSAIVMRNMSGHPYPTSLRLARFALIACATALLAGCGGLDRNGQFREDPLENFEQKVIGGALASAGIIPPQREKITYTPRAPLALPPPQAAGRLRPPEDSAEIAAANPIGRSIRMKRASNASPVNGMVCGGNSSTIIRSSV